MKYTKEVKTGLLAVFAILLFIFGYNYLKGSNLLHKDRVFYAIYENVEGLDISSDVTISGLKVGKIQEINLTGREGILVVKFSVGNDFEFSKNSIARIYGGGIIGGKSLAIIPNPDPAPYAVSGDTLTSDVEEGIMELVNERLTPLQLKIENIVVSADSLLNSFNQVMDPATRENLRKSIANITEASSSFKGTSASLESLIADNKVKLDRTFNNLDNASGNFATLSDSLSQLQVGKLIGDVENAIASFNDVASQLNEVTTKLNNGEGSLGKLLQDDSLYNNLENGSRQLEQLLQDIKLNPKRYVHFSVFGKNPGPYEEPADPEK